MSFERFGKQIAEGRADLSIRERSDATYATRGAYSTFYRFVVLDVVFDPTSVDEAKVAHWEHTLGVTNIKWARVLPRNAIIAQRVLEGTASSNERPMFLFPFFPPAFSMPANPGEQVWVIFEDRANKQSDIGYWMSRVVGPGFVEDVNHTHMPRAFDSSYVAGTKDAFDGKTEPRYGFNLGKVVEDDGVTTSTVETSTVATENERFYVDLMTQSDAGALRTYEVVPRFKKRPADIALEGANNALIVVGQHRTGPVASYDVDDERGKVPAVPPDDVSGGRSGCIDLVVGRGQTERTLGKVVKNEAQFEEVAKGPRDVQPSEGDPDLDADRSRVMLTQRSRVDIDLGIDGFNRSVTVSGGVFQGAGQSRVEDAQAGDGSVVVKSDKIRLIARSDIEILVSGFTRDSEGRMVAGDDVSSFAALIIKANGDIVLRPAEHGYLKCGGDDADRAVLCTDVPATAADGKVTAAPLITTMGGQFGNTGIAGQGTWASKILVKA